MRHQYIRISKRCMIIIIILSLFFPMSFNAAFQLTTNQSKEIIFNINLSSPHVITNNDGIEICLSMVQHKVLFKDSILPVKPIRLLLPQGTKIDDITVKTTTPIEFKEHHFNEGLDHKNASTVSNINYVKHKKSEQSCFEFVGQYWSHGYPIVFINLYPVFYDIQTNHYCFYEEMTIQISTSSDPFSYVLRENSNDKKLVSSLVDNKDIIQSYHLINSEKNQDHIPFIIITNKNLLNSPLEDDFNYLLYSKNQKGITAAVYTVEEIISNPAYSVNGTWGDNNPENPFYHTEITHNYSLFDDTQARIRNFIRYAYSEFGIEYVLLGGDADKFNISQNIIPARGLFANESGLPLINQSFRSSEEQDDIPSDVYYACLDGNYNTDMDSHFGESADRNSETGVDEADLLSEVYVGRVCADSFEEIAYFVSKTLRYESLIGDPYLSKMLFAGESLGFPGISAWGGNYKDEIIPLVPASFHLETLYDRDLPSHWGKQDIIEIINENTPHIINHDGHSYYGYNLKMYNEDVDSLMNLKPFILYSHGCMAGGFDNPQGYDCIGERLTVETSYGAVATILNSRYGLGSENSLASPSFFLDESFFKALYAENITEIGKANHFSKEDNIWRINQNGVRWVYYETNLFGDPMLQIHSPLSQPLELHYEILSPEPEEGFLYLFNDKIFSVPFMNKPFVIGEFQVHVNACSQPIGHVHGVEFSIGGTPSYFDNQEPYRWIVNESFIGKRLITITVYSYYGEKESSSFSVIGFVMGKK